MKALSTKQPWANLIAGGEKCIEIRTWTTKYIGPLAIHASKTVDLEGARLFKKTPTQPRGYIIAKGYLTLVVKYYKKHFIEDHIYHLNPVEWYRKGLYGWLIEGIEKINPPIPCKGSQGLFEVRLDE